MKINLFGAIRCPKNNDQKALFLMKLSFLFYAICCFQLIAFNTFAQNKVTLDIENGSLESIINQIEAQTTYNFVFNNDVIDVQQNFSLKVVEKDINRTIDLLFKRSSISYKIKKKLVILSQVKKLSNNFTISGVITDADTGETLLGANVILKDKGKGAITNAYGFYSITLPKETYILEISYLGYATKDIEIELKEDIKLTIELEPSLSNLDEIIIASNRSSKSQVTSVLSGRTKLRTSEIKRLPSLLGEPDITRALLTQAGISTTREGSTGFSARGGNIDQNLVLLDEAPLYNSSHLFGFFSIFNADAIKDVTLYKGEIPARFGGRGSSVLDIRQKNGNTKHFKGEGGLGLLFSRLTLEGPIVKDKFSFLLSGRRSYFDLFFPFIEGAEDTKFHFYDLNTKLSWNINENNTLYASGFFGADIIGLEEESNDNESSIGANWSNATTTLRWNHVFTNKLFANFTGVYSKYNFSIDEKDALGEAVEQSAKRSIDNFILKPDFTYYQSPTTKMRFGLNSTLYKFIPADISSTQTDLQIDDEKALELAVYYSIEKEWNKLSVLGGLRYSWFANLGPGDVTLYNPDFPQTTNTAIGTKNYSKNEIIKQYAGFEPRLSLKYNFNDRKAFKLGYNRMFQYIHLISNANSSLPFDLWKPSGTYIDPLEVNQFSAGYAYDSQKGNYNLSIEGYFKTFNNIVEYKNGARTLSLSNTLETELVPAKGFAYGLELTAHKNRGKLTGNANYTYSVAKRKTVSDFSTERINDGAYFPSNFDRPHMFNITTSYKLSKKWEMGAFFTYQTGGPTTQPNGRLTFNDDTFLTYSDRNAYRVSDTHRMDISFTYTPEDNPKTKWQGSWNFGFYNIYGNNNAFSTRSRLDNDVVRISEISFIVAPIPFITYNFKF
ncbi:MAG: TonB-dependent receptor [Algibacter sp.]